MLKKVLDGDFGPPGEESCVDNVQRKVQKKYLHRLDHLESIKEKVESLQGIVLVAQKLLLEANRRVS